MIRPDAPVPYWGWGSIPDQYGRRWADDDGNSREPRRLSRPHPMLVHAWPAREEVPVLDLSELRAAIAGEDAVRFLAAVRGHDIDDALQHVGAGIPMALERRRQDAEPVALSVINRLTWRAGTGDEVLAEDLLACLRREPLVGRVVPVDLETLAAELEGDLGVSTGGYVDLRTGEVYDDNSTDPMIVGQEAVVDVEEEPDRWLRFERIGSRDGWRDMAAFAERQHDAALRERLERAIHGAGAFRRFRDLVVEEALAEQWYTFAADRQRGRAREFLAGRGHPGGLIDRLRPRTGASTGARGWVVRSRVPAEGSVREGRGRRGDGAGEWAVGGSWGSNLTPLTGGRIVTPVRLPFPPGGCVVAG